MKFREHRGTLADSMQTQVELPDRAALLAHIAKLLEPFGYKFEPSWVHVEPYAWYEADKAYWDKRVRWHTYIVTLDGYGVLGFTDGPA